MKKFLGVFSVLLLSIGFAPLGIAAGGGTPAPDTNQCSTNDFYVGIPSIYASSCLSGNAKNNQIEALLEGVVGVDLLEIAKYENDGGAETGDLTVTALNPNGFAWSSTQTVKLENAIFLVKQADYKSPNNDTDGDGVGISWVAYFFGKISTNIGGFFTEGSFTVNNYSHLSLYGTEVHSVPEIDASSAGIAFAFIFALVALLRERRFSIKAA